MTSSGTKVCHLTTVHPRFDTRVFHKECSSLARSGYQVTLVVNDGKGDELAQGVSVVDIGGHRSRITRFVVALPKALIVAIKARAKIYHYHDPELMLVGFVLTLLGKKVVYDVHEDLPNDIFNKPWVSASLKRPLSMAVEFAERLASRVFFACVVTTPFIEKRFQGYAGTTVLLRNYPETADRNLQSDQSASDEFKMCYAGAISSNRGLVEMVEAAEKTETRLVLMGPIAEPDLFKRLQAAPAWRWVEYLGILPKSQVNEVYERCSLGLAILHPDPNYVNALPIKLFEYMMYGMPVICSNFDLWTEIVDVNECGLCVDPLDVEAVCAAIRTIKSDGTLAKRMGSNGKQAVRKKYVWEAEFLKLDTLYQSAGS